MFKRFRSVSMLLFLGGISVGVAHATPSMLEANVVQQSNVCKGVVKDAQGETIIGASVVVKGTTNGTITGFDGDFTLESAKKGDILEISFVGYVSQEVKWNGEPLKITLKEDTKTLDEVVVVGYGVQKKANLSGSVASVDKEQLQNRPIQNVSSGLQGLMPGVTITGTNGAPGMDSGSIRVRGTGTLNTASPYILIDGVESETMSSIDPNDIESISVLKDAASAAIYGSKAANGVILITTKRGSTGKPKISYSGYVSFQNATNMIDRLSSYEYASMYNQALQAEGKAPRFTDEEIQKFKDGTDPLYPNTDWYDLAYKTGIQHRHNLNIAGGTENVRYMGSIGYLNQTGVLPNAGREQFNARTNLDMKITKRLSAKLNLAYIKNAYDDASSAYYGGSSDQIIRQLNLIAPWIVARYDDGTWGTISDGSPIAWLDSGMKVTRDNHNFTGMASLDYKILDCLTFTATGSYVNNMQNYTYFQKFIQYNANKASDPNSLDERYYTWNRTNYDLLLNYDQTFGKHNIKGLAGWHTEKYNYKELTAYRKDFPNNDLTDINAGDAASQTNSGYYQSSYKLSTITWEKATTWGVGLDFGFLNNKINGSLDFYNRKTTGILMQVSVPTEFALNPYTDNVGSMNNKGVELNIGYNDRWGDWTFGVAANFAYNKNEILDLGGADYLDTGYNQRNAVGQSINAYYIYKTDGFFNSQEEADAFTAKYGNPFGAGGFKAGDLKYVDTNGDGKLNGDDRVYTNSTEPVYTFGLNLTAGWKGFDLSLMFNGAAKVARLFDSHEVYGAFSGDAGHPASIWKDAWTETNKDASMPRIFTDTNSPSSSRSAQSTFWLQNTNYLRLKNLQFGYTLPKSLLSNWGVDNVRFYYSVENLFTIDNMKISIDPEATSQRLSSYPLLRTHAFGVNITF